MILPLFWFGCWLATMNMMWWIRGGLDYNGYIYYHRVEPMSAVKKLVLTPFLMSRLTVGFMNPILAIVLIILLAPIMVGYMTYWHVRFEHNYHPFSNYRRFRTCY